jgi:hypothetical protein
LTVCWYSELISKCFSDEGRHGRILAGLNGETRRKLRLCRDPRLEEADKASARA